MHDVRNTKYQIRKQETKMKFESQLLKGIAPVVVLEILSGGQMYGYELSEAIEQRSAEVLTLGKGTLYPLLYNLEAKKLVRGRWEQAESGRKRRYYSITGKGKEELAKQKAQLKELTTGLNLIFSGALAPA
jgi:PadR family transcriptional regulator PadR